MRGEAASIMWTLPTQRGILTLEGLPSEGLSLENRSAEFDALFERALKHYSALIKSQCRAWENHKHSADDLFSEALIVFLRVLRHNAHLGVESLEFKRLLLRSVRNRITDLNRSFFTKKRNRTYEVSYDPCLDDRQMHEARHFSSPIRPDDVISAMDLARKLELKLSETDRRMLRQLLSPSDELLAKMRERDLLILEKSGRRSAGANTEIPVVLLGSQIGLSYRQARKSLERIRRIAAILVDAI